MDSHTPSERSEGSENNFSIEPLRYRDVWAFARMRNDIDGESPWLVAHAGERRETPLRVLVRMLINGRLKTLVVKDKGRLVGYVSVVFPRFRKLRHNAYLVVSIRATHRGRGLGTELMRAAEDLARAHGATRMELEVFAKSPAVELYRRLGYEEEGRKRGHIQNEDGPDDMIFMAKFLNN